jgi:hypothetical protein
MLKAMYKALGFQPGDFLEYSEEDQKESVHFKEYIYFCG